MSDPNPAAGAAAEPEVADPPTATVQKLPSGWHLVSFGSWSVSVAPDGLIRLPMSASPASVPDLCGALTAAAEVGAGTQTANKDREAARTDEERWGIHSPGGGVHVREGSPPVGATPVPVGAKVVRTSGRK